MGSNHPTPASCFKIASALDAVTLTASANGLIIDTRGFDGGWLTFIVNVGTTTTSSTGSMAITVEEDDNSGMSSALTVAGATFTTIVAGTGATYDKTLQGAIKLQGRERYLRLVVTETGTVTACPIAAVALLHGATYSADVDSTYEFSV
jgi:hypothetical protein